MRELTYIAPGKLEWHERPDPVIQTSTDAIVRPLAATTCDLDQLIIRGRSPFIGPFAIGHECLGEVVEIGEGVRLHSVGDVVVVHWHISCGHCYRCTSARPNSCANHQPGAMYGLPGMGDWGGTFSDLLRIVSADTALTPLPTGMDLAGVASAADNLPFGYEFTVPHLAASPGAEMLVIGGCGSIALYALMFAAAAGAARVVYHDVDPARLSIAERLGAEVLDGEVPQSAGRFPIVVDASAQAASLRCALRSVEPEGIVSSVGGHFKDEPMPLFEMYRRGVRFYTGRGRGAPNVACALEWVADGRVDPMAIVSDVAFFDDAPDVLATPRLKPVLTRPAIHIPTSGSERNT